MNISKILEVVNTYIEEIEKKLEFKDIEIENLKYKIKRLEKENDK